MNLYTYIVITMNVNNILKIYLKLEFKIFSHAICKLMNFQQYVFIIHSFYAII